MKRLRHRRTEAGQALVELGLLLPLLLVILLGIVEVGNSLYTYLTIVETSREAALLVAREGESADVRGLVKTLTEELPASRLETRVFSGADGVRGQMVKVEISYDYKPILGGVPVVQEILPDPFTLRAITTMPAP